MLKSILLKIYKTTENYRVNVIKDTLKKYGPYENFLDVGCWDGSLTSEYLSKTNAKNIFGIEPIQVASKQANLNGIETKSFYADKDDWDFQDSFFDCIHSSEVIEHISNVDFFINQAEKKLKSGGYLIITSNNLASLHNIISLIMGWAPFDLTNSSFKSLSIGNPFAIHKGEKFPIEHITWTHKCVYTPYWLRKWIELYNFEFVEYYGSGFYPFHPVFGSIFKKMQLSLL